MEKIYIKAYFGEWKEVTFEEAVEFFKLITDGASENGLKKTFDKHFKGVTYEQLKGLK